MFMEVSDDCVGGICTLSFIYAHLSDLTLAAVH